MSLIQPDGDLDVHLKEVCVGSVEASGNGSNLSDVAANRDRDEIAGPHSPVRWVKGDPACAWQEDFHPCMRGAGP